MATDTPATGTPNTDSEDRFALLELDLPAAPAAPALPMWAQQAIQRIEAAKSTDDIAAAIAPCRTQPEGAAKSAVRAAKDARVAQMRAATTPVVVSALAILTGLWLRLWGSLGTALAAPGGLAFFSPPHVTTAPRLGTWVKLRTGPLKGTWGARVPANAQYVVTGSLVRLRRTNGAESLHMVQSIVWSDAHTTICSVSEQIAANSAAQPEIAAESAQEPTGDRLVQRFGPHLVGAQSAPEPTSENSTLAGDLGSIATEAEHNAAHLDTAQGGVARSQVNTIAGFNSPEAYAQAAAATVTQATRDEYIRRAAAGGIIVDPASLPPLPTQNLPVSQNPTVHKPVGPSIFDKPRAERTFKVGESQTRKDVQALLNGKNLIAGDVADGSPVQISWTGGGTTTVEAVTEALAEIGRASDAPGAPSAIRHAGRAVDTLRNRELDTARLSTGDLPQGIKARWLVGRKLTGSGATAGQAYGTALLIVSITDGDKLEFDGDQTLATAVANDYTRRTAKETLRSEDLTAWLGLLLKHTHHAVKRGPHFYVPGGQSAAARQLSETIGKLWGDHDQISVTSGPDLIRSIARGLTDEIAAVAKAFDTAIEAARDRAESKALADAGKAKRVATEDEVRVARERAVISPTVAARLLTDLAKVAGRVGGYEVLLGEEHTKAAKGQIAVLKTKIEPLADDTSLFAAQWELD